MSQTKSRRDNSNETDDPDQGDGDWEIIRITDHRIVQENPVYKVQWRLRKGQKEDWPDWENWAVKLKAPELLELYKRKLSPRRLIKLVRADMRRMPGNDPEGVVVSGDEIDSPRNKGNHHQKEKGAEKPHHIRKSPLKIKKRTRTPPPVAVSHRKKPSWQKEFKMVKKHNFSYDVCDSSDDGERHEAFLEDANKDISKKKEETRREKCPQKSPVRRDAISSDSSSSDDSSSNPRIRLPSTNSNIISVDREKVRQQAKRMNIPSTTKHTRGMIDYRSDGILLSGTRFKALENHMMNRKRGTYRAKESLLQADELLWRTTPPSEASSSRSRGEPHGNSAMPLRLPQWVGPRSFAALPPLTEENEEIIDDVDEIEDEEGTAPPESSENLMQFLPNSKNFDIYERFARECFQFKYNAIENRLQPIHVLQFFEKPAEDGEEEPEEWAMVIFKNKSGARPQHVCEAVLTEKMIDINIELVIDCEERLKHKDAVPLSISSNKWNAA